MIEKEPSIKVGDMNQQIKYVLVGFIYSVFYGSTA